MKNSTLINLSMLLLLCLPARSMAQTGQIVNNPNAHVIDVSTVEKEERIYLSSFFSKARTIILETPKDAVITEVAGMQTAGNYLFIMDSEYANSIFIFDKSGRFIRRIGKIGEGPGEYIEVGDFTLDTARKEIYLLDFGNDHILKYNYETGAYLNSIAMKEGIYTHNIQFNRGRLYTDVFFHDRETKDQYRFQELAPITGAQIRTWLNEDKQGYNKGWPGYVTKEESYFYSRNQGCPKYVQMLMDSVLFFEGDNMAPFLVLKDSNWVTAEDVKRLNKDCKGTDYNVFTTAELIKEGIAHNISNYVECGNLIYFRYSRRAKSFSFVYDTSCKKIRLTDYLWNDLIHRDGHIILSKVGCADDNGIYEYNQGINLEILIKVARKNELSPGLDKKDQLKKLKKKKSNPVIFYYERK